MASQKIGLPVAGVDSELHGPPAPASTSRMTVAEQLQKAEELKSQGNQAFERGELTEALKSWHHVSTSSR